MTARKGPKKKGAKAAKPKGRGGKKPPAPGPGDRQAGETDVAFAAFRIYLEAGPARSTAKVGEKLGHRSSKQAEKWSARWSWVQRVKEFEATAIEQVDAAHMDEIARRAREQARIAALHGDATAVVADEVMRRTAGDTAAKKGLRDMPWPQLLALEGSHARAHNRAVLSERLARGMTTDQPGEPLPRSEAEEAARRLSPDELDAKLEGVDELAERREKKAKAKGKAAAS